MGHVWKNRMIRGGPRTTFWRCDLCYVIVKSDEEPPAGLLVLEHELSTNDKIFTCEDRTIYQVMAM